MRTRRFYLAGLALLCTATLSACGFTPMYGSASSIHQLEDMRVETGDARSDFYLQEALLDRLNARHAAGPLSLRAQSSATRTSLGLGTDDEARRYGLTLMVSYAVYRDGSSDPIYRGRTQSEVFFDAPSEVYAVEAAQRDAETRAAEAAADRIVLQLARALRQMEAQAQ